MQGRSPKSCRRRHFPAQARRPHRRARRETLPRSRRLRSHSQGARNEGRRNRSSALGKAFRSGGTESSNPASSSGESGENPAIDAAQGAGATRSSLKLAPPRSPALHCQAACRWQPCKSYCGPKSGSPAAQVNDRAPRAWENVMQRALRRPLHQRGEAANATRWHRRWG